MTHIFQKTIQFSPPKYLGLHQQFTDSAKISEDGKTITVGLSTAVKNSGLNNFLAAGHDVSWYITSANLENLSPLVIPSNIIHGSMNNYGSYTHIFERGTPVEVQHSAIIEYFAQREALRNMTPDQIQAGLQAALVSAAEELRMTNE